MSNLRDKLIEPDKPSEELNKYREAGKGFTGESDLPGTDQILDDSTGVARQATVPEDFLNTPPHYEIKKEEELPFKMDEVKGDFAAKTENETSQTEQEETRNDKSYMPGSGAVRTAEDRLPPGKVDKDSIPPGAGIGQ